jgi:hypothetical protein
VRRFAARLFLLLLAVSAFPQSSKQRKQEDNLYADALTASITEMQKQWGYVDDSDNGSRKRTDFNHMIVRKDPELTDGLSSEFGEHHIEYLDDQALAEKYNALKKEFAVLTIHPIHKEGAHLRIQVSTSWVEYKKKGLWFGISDWSDVEFQYDCDKRRYVISSVELGGI